jgi:hypothetical protein
MAGIVLALAGLTCGASGGLVGVTRGERTCLNC